MTQRFPDGQSHLHPTVRRVLPSGLPTPTDPELAIFLKQHTGPGSTESLAQHPAAMTHSVLTPEDKQLGGITPDLIRLSIGLENHEDLIWDLRQALDHV